MAVVTLCGLVPYSLCFAPGCSVLVGFPTFPERVGAAPDPDYAGTIPLQTFMVYS